MSSVVISGDTSGAITLSAPAVAGTNTITLPASTGTVLTTGSPQSGGVIQVVSTSITSQSTYSSSYANITGFNLSITPKFSTSKIFLIANLYAGNNTSSANIYFQFTRNGTAIGVGTADSQSISAGGGFRQLSDGQAVYGVFPIVLQYLDSPATTSAITYQVQTANNAGTTYINYSPSGNNLRSILTITAMEIAA